MRGPADLLVIVTEDDVLQCDPEQGRILGATKVLDARALTKWCDRIHAKWGKHRAVRYAPILRVRRDVLLEAARRALGRVKRERAQLGYRSAAPGTARRQELDQRHQGMKDVAWLLRREARR